MPGSPLNFSLPTSSDSWPTWSSKLITILQAIEADLEPAILFTELSPDANLDFNNFSLTGVNYLQCYAGNTATLPARSVGLKNGDWFVVDAAGNNIQLTANGQLNFASTGGFVGDYVSSGAQASYVNATSLYEFKGPSGTNYVPVRMDDLKLRNGATAELTVGWAGSTDMAWLFPTTNPAAVALLTVSNTGQISHSATVGTAISFNNANITLQGTTDIKHPDLTCTYPGGGMSRSEASGGFSTDINGSLLSDTLAFDVHLVPQGEMQRSGARLKSVALRINKTSTNTTTMNLYKVTDGARGAAIATVATSSSGVQTITATVGSPSTLAVGDSWGIQVTQGAGAASTLRNFRIVWDRP